MSRIGRQRYVPAEDQDRGNELSPVEQLLAAADSTMAPRQVMRTLDSEPVFPPWEPTGEESPKKTIESAPDLEFSPPPPETAGGSIPSAYAHFRRYGPDES